MGSANFSLLDNQDDFGNQYYPADDRAVVITKEIWDELLRSVLGAVDVVTNAQSPFTVTKAHNILLCDTSGGAITINLPPAADTEGMWAFTIKKTSSDFNTVTIDPDGTETIDGTTTRTLLNQYASITIASDGSNWFIVG